MRHCPRITIPSLLAAALFLVASGTVSADEATHAKEQTLAEVRMVAENMASHQEQAPDEAGRDVSEEFQQMIDDASRQLELDAGASDAQIESFREDAEAIGREHDLLN